MSSNSSKPVFSLWLRRLAIGVPVGMAALYAVAVLSMVRTEDVARYYGFGQPQRLPGIDTQSGSIFAIAPDGQPRPQLLCSTVLDMGKVVHSDEKKEFYNFLAAALPFIDAILEWQLPGIPDVDGSYPTRITFEGKLVRLKTGASGASTEECERRMVALVGQGYRICRVRTALYREKDASFVAFGYDSDQIWIPEETFRKYGRERTPLIEKRQTLPCPAADPLPWDVAVRGLLGVVLERQNMASAAIAEASTG